MIKFIYSVFLILVCLPIHGQEVADPENLTKGRYILDNQSDIDFQSLGEDNVWNLSNLEEDEDIRIGDTRAREISIPFFGFVKRNSAGDLDQLNISDPLMNYGTRTVKLDRPITIQHPEPGIQSTGYTIILGPEAMDQNALNQLPIRPDSVKVSVTANIIDSEWSYKAFKFKSPYLENRSFEREIQVERSVQIKIAPFGWTAVNSVAPMIDWDRSYIIEQRYFIAEEINIPYAIIDYRNGSYRAAVFDFGKTTEAITPITGTPQIKAVPNPVINDVHFEISNIREGVYTIKIKNILGEIKVQKEIQYLSSSIFPVDIESLRKGSYFYVLEDDRGNVLSTKRLIVLKP